MPDTLSTPATFPVTLPEAMQRKLQTLEHVPGLPAGAVTRFAEILASLDDWQLYRLSPLQLVREHGIELPLLLDLLLHSTRLGLFDLNWTVVCPGCGSIEYTFETINALKTGTVFCPTCNRDFAFVLDEQVEVSFSLHPGINDLSGTIDPYASFENYSRYYFTQSLKRTPELLAYIQAQYRGFFVAGSDEHINLALSAEPDSLYRVINLQTHSQFFLRTGSESAGLPVVVETDLGERGFVESERQVPAGELTIRVHNCSSRRSILTLWKADFTELYRIASEFPCSQEPFLTAKMLLNSQTFREIYRIQQLDPDLRLSIGNQTLLFTDLKGSTAMYEETGDYQAYSLVQRHFDKLMACTRRHSGSVVKTIGDAIMASFSTPLDGLRAALEMIHEIHHLNQASGEIDLGLKVGLHTGPVLAVNANERLDFFGQTVNLAARVQGLAEAGEIWMTEAVYHAGAAELLEAAGYHSEPKSAFLKGISAATPVRRCWTD
ncbi:MAG: DUF5939 domain-containing protein [Candidatus Sericytochromatia bacterium]